MEWPNPVRVVKEVTDRELLKRAREYFMKITLLRGKSLAAELVDIAHATLAPCNLL